MYKIQTLKNGLHLIMAPLSGTKTITVLVVVGTGSKYEARETNGISHFLEHLFFKGTTKRPTPTALLTALDSIGGEYNAFTSKEYTGYFVKAASEKLPRVLEIVSDMLLHSLFNQAEIEREKGVIKEEINMYHDNPIMYLEDVFETCLYGDTPAGWETVGSKAAITKLIRPDFLKYLNSQYGSHNTFIVITGALSLPGVPPKAFGGTTKQSRGERVEARDRHAPQNAGLAMTDLVNKYFSSPQFSARDKHFEEKVKVEEKQIKPNIKIHYKKTNQAHLSLGVRAYGYGHKDRAVLQLLSLILGGSMGSRLFLTLREKHGLAYYVRNETEFYTDCGYLTTRAGVPVPKLTKALGIILKEYRRLTTELVPLTELKLAQDLFKGKLIIQFEASDDLASWYGRQAIMEATITRTRPRAGNNWAKQIITPEKFMKEIDQVSPTDLRRVAKEIFKNERLNLAIIGPYKDEESFKKILHL